MTALVLIATFGLGDRGDSGARKDLVHTGDTVNVAARIEGQCHVLSARLSALESTLALAPLPQGFHAEPVGEVGLRGRTGAVRLLNISTRIR